MKAKLLAVLAIAALAAVFAQGPLPPPIGAPAPAMKTLQQIEPRIDLQAPTLPPGVTTDANYHFIINQPGSYYLSSNLEVTKTNGVDVRAAGVTIELNGFEVRRASGASGHGIEIDGTSDRCAVKNGSITGFAYGIRCIIGASYPRGCSFRELAVGNCNTAGIWAGLGAVLESCRAHGNSGSHGLFSAFGSLLINCTATNNTSSDGIFAGAGSSLINCSASDNTGIGIVAAQGCALTNCSALSNIGTYGISVGEHCTLTNCSARTNTATVGIQAARGSSLFNCVAAENTSAVAASYGIQTDEKCTVANCTVIENTNSSGATGTTGAGISAGEGSTIKDCTVGNNKGNGIIIAIGSTVTGCTVRENGFDGILAPNDCVITRNNCTANGTQTTDGAGIHTTSAGNRIEENHSIINDFGYKVDGTESVIIRNASRFNTSNWSIANDNRFGPVIDMTGVVVGGFTGNGAATTLPAGADHPWANFTH